MGLNDEESRPKLDLARGEEGAGAGAMRTTGAMAASSGCKNELLMDSAGVL